MGGACASMTDRRDVYRVLVGRPQGGRPLGRPRRRREFTIKIDFFKIFWQGVERVDLYPERDKLWAFVLYTW